MILFLVLIAIVAALAGLLISYSERTYSLAGGAAGFAGFFLAGCVGLAALVGPFAWFAWTGAVHKAEVINREYGTSYTPAEIFWASSVINTVREVGRQRIELNGDLARGLSCEG